MARCRLHVFLPDDDTVPGGPEAAEEKRAELRAAFGEIFTESPEAATQDTSREWVSEIFEDTPENVERIDEFEAACLDVYPDADILRTRQSREAVDGGDGYDDCIFLTVTLSLV